MGAPRERLGVRACAAHHACALVVTALLAFVGCAPVPEPPLPSATRTLDPDVAALVQARSKAVRTLPDDDAAWLALGMAYEANGMLDLAAACYQHVVGHRPINARAWYRIAIVRTALGETDAARAALRRVMLLEPDYLPAQVRLGQLELESGNADAARRHFEGVLQRDPSDLGALLGLARLLLQSGDAAGAAALVDRAGGKHPRDPRIAVLGSSTRRALGASDDGASARDAKAPPLPDPWAAEAAASWVGFAADMARAERALEDERAEEAVKLLERHASRRGTDVTYLVVLGSAQVASHSVEAGLATLQRAVELDTTNPVARTKLALAHLRAKHPHEALAQATTARSLGTCSAEADEIRGIALRQLDKHDDALDAFRDAVACDPGRTSARRYLGAMQFELRRLEEAETTYAAVVAADPSDANAWLGLGMARLDLGRLAEAEEALHQAEEHGPKREWQVHAALKELERRKALADVP